VGVDDRVPLGVGNVLHEIKSKNSSARDKRVNLGEAIDGRFEKGIDRITIGNIASHRQCLAAALLDFGHQILGRCIIDIRDYDRGSILRETPCASGTNPAATASHQGDPTVEAQRFCPRLQRD
jgi:hypothetical protein